jgi:hypothetical protein
MIHEAKITMNMLSIRCKFTKELQLSRYTMCFHVQSSSLSNLFHSNWFHDPIVPQQGQFWIISDFKKFQQLHLTLQSLSHYTALLPKAHMVEIEATLRDHVNCKLSFIVLLFLLPSSYKMCVLFPDKFSHYYESSDILRVKSKDWAQYVQDEMPLMHSTWSKYMIRWKEAFLHSLEIRKRNCGRSSFLIISNGGITEQRS